MKISNLPDNGLFHERADTCIVTLNGKTISNFVYADDDSEDGKVTYFDNEGKLATSKGKVVITFPEVKVVEPKEEKSIKQVVK